MELKVILLPLTCFISKSRVACVQTPPPLKKKNREWASICTRDNSGGASSSNVESYNRSDSGIIITKNLVHFVLLLKDNSLSHFRTPKN